MEVFESIESFLGLHNLKKTLKTFKEEINTIFIESLDRDQDLKLLGIKFFILEMIQNDLEMKKSADTRRKDLIDFARGQTDDKSFAFDGLVSKIPNSTL